MSRNRGDLGAERVDRQPSSQFAQLRGRLLSCTDAVALQLGLVGARPGQQQEVFGHPRGGHPVEFTGEKGLQAGDCRTGFAAPDFELRESLHQVGRRGVDWVRGWFDQAGGLVKGAMRRADPGSHQLAPRIVGSHALGDLAQCRRRVVEAPCGQVSLGQVAREHACPVGVEFPSGGDLEADLGRTFHLVNGRVLADEHVGEGHRDTDLRERISIRVFHVEGFGRQRAGHIMVTYATLEPCEVGHGMPPALSMPQTLRELDCPPYDWERGAVIADGREEICEVLHGFDLFGADIQLLEDAHRFIEQRDALVHVADVAVIITGARESRGAQRA
jgi:hypothetical protein